MKSNSKKDLIKKANEYKEELNRRINTVEQTTKTNDMLLNEKLVMEHRIDGWKVPIRPQTRKIIRNLILKDRIYALKTFEKELNEFIKKGSF